MTRVRNALVSTLLLAGIAALAGPARAVSSSQAAVRAGVSVVEAGVDKDDNKLYNVIADSADLADLLKALFGRVGEQYGIAQDVTGTIDLRVQGATMEQILRRVREFASPPLRIDHDAQGYHVRREPMSQLNQIDQAHIARIQANGIPNVISGPGMAGGFGPGGPIGNTLMPAQGNLPTDRYVTFDVPRTRPVPLADVLARVSAQTGVSIMLDRRVPRDVLFFGHATQSSLPLALQAIADAARLKIVLSGTQVYMVPADELTALLANNRVGAVPFGQFPTILCPRCGQTVLAGWSFCPHCGLSLLQGQKGQAGITNQNPFRNRGDVGSQRYPR